MHAPATHFRWLGLLALWAVLGALQLAQAGPADTSAKPLPPQEARKWLARIHTAAHERNYQGTLVFSADGALSSARVAHFCEGAQSYERVEVLWGLFTYEKGERRTIIIRGKPGFCAAVLEDLRKKGQILQA